MTSAAHAWKLILLRRLLFAIKCRGGSRMNTACSPDQSGFVNESFIRTIQ
jgi:hypothetical protein